VGQAHETGIYTAEKYSLKMVYAVQATEADENQINIHSETRCQKPDRIGGANTRNARTRRAVATSLKKENSRSHTPKGVSVWKKNPFIFKTKSTCFFLLFTVPQVFSLC
jgi:hypothetical protein